MIMISINQYEGMSKLFDSATINLTDNISIHIIDIKILSEKLKKYLDDQFVYICEGNSGSNLSEVKKIILDFLHTKDPRTKMGATAEFFIHLYLKSLGFKQECLFLNLEERSIKKGFDGYYSTTDSLEFIMESKSGSSETAGITHTDKINEAYQDLKNNIAGSSKKSKNNPWKNAYNHASHADIGTHTNIRKKIKQLSDDYNNSIFYDIKDFNIIPSSTIFLDGVWTSEYSDDIIESIKALISGFSFNQLKVICVTQMSLDIFQQYIEE